MSKFKLVYNGKDTRIETIERLSKKKFDTKRAAHRAATEANIQDYVDVVEAKTRKKK